MKLNKETKQNLMFVLIALAGVILYHQYSINGMLFQLQDLHSHEAIASGLLMLALGIYIGDRV